MPWKRNTASSNSAPTKANPDPTAPAATTVPVPHQLLTPSKHPRSDLQPASRRNSLARSTPSLDNARSKTRRARRTRRLTRTPSSAFSSPSAVQPAPSKLHRKRSVSPDCYLPQSHALFNLLPPVSQQHEHKKLGQEPRLTPVNLLAVRSDSR